MNDVLDQVLANPIVTTIGGAIGTAMVALWLAAAWWAYADAARRTASIPAALLAAAWVIVSTPLLLVLSLPVYALVRPAESAGERRTRRLAAELRDVLEELGPSCLSCGNAVDPAWHRCPTCTTWLALPCAGCGTWSERTLPSCPYCGAEERLEPGEHVVEPAAATARAAASERGARRRARSVGNAGRTSPRRGSRRPAPEGRPLAPARVG